MESSLMWNRIRLCELTGKTALHLVTFYAIQLWALCPQQKEFLAGIKLQVAKTFFRILSLAKMGVAGLAC